MLGDEGFRLWTRPFGEGSHYQGAWNEGSTVRFLAMDEGSLEGTFLRVLEVRPFEKIRMEVVGLIRNGEEDTTSEFARAYAGAREEYEFIEQDGKTVLRVLVDADERCEDMLAQAWPIALEHLRALAEG